MLRAQRMGVHAPAFWQLGGRFWKFGALFWFRFRVGDLKRFGFKSEPLSPKPLNPDPLNPKPLNPKQGVGVQGLASCPQPSGFRSSVLAAFWAFAFRGLCKIEVALLP